jgi:hypothetical protein
MISKHKKKAFNVKKDLRLQDFEKYLEFEFRVFFFRLSCSRKKGIREDSLFFSFVFT